MFTATVSSKQANCITLAIGGNVNEETLPQIALLIDDGRQVRANIVLDLSEVTLIDPAAATFLREQSQNGVELVNCPVYIRRWILRDASHEEQR
jgi:anti-anti-sigma regulatory factor